MIGYFGNKAIDLIDWIRHSFLYSYYQHNEDYISSGEILVRTEVVLVLILQASSRVVCILQRFILNSLWAVGKWQDSE